VDVKLNFTKNC